MAVVHGGAAGPKKTKRVFLHTGTAKTGEAVCYNWDVTDVSAENEAVLTASAAMWCDARQVMVEAPSYYNNCHFAGVIDESSDGVVGPNWIMVHEPGSICKIRTAGTASAGASYRNTGQKLTFTIARNSADAVNTTYNAMFYTQGLPGRGSAVVLAEGAASVPGDSYLKMARLEDGTESGGVQTVGGVSLVMGRSATTLGCINHGFIYYGLAVTTTERVQGQISVAAGSFIGQHLVIQGPPVAISCIVSVDCAKIAVPFTTGPAAMGAQTLMTASTGNLTTDTKFMDMTWNGVCWLTFGNTAIS